MYRECPYCNAELIWEDSFGVGNITAQEKYGYGWNKIGNIYRCPNHEGFQHESEAMEYLNESATTFSDLGIISWEEMVCESNVHHVYGSFYYYGDGGDLNCGYPC